MNQESITGQGTGSSTPVELGVVPAQNSIPVVSADNDIRDNKDIAALSYVWVLSIFVLFYKHRSPFVRFHAVQGTVLFLLSIGSVFLPALIGRMAGLLVLGMCVWGFVSAAQGMWKELPLIHTLASGDIKALRRDWKETVNAIAALWHRMRNHAGKNQPAKAESTPDTSPSPTPPAV